MTHGPATLAPRDPVRPGRESRNEARPPTPAERFGATRTFGSLDGLRAIAILAVVWHHAHPGTQWMATHRGFLGVDLFFVISGFLIVTLLLRERDRHGIIDLRAFYVRRALQGAPDTSDYFVWQRANGMPLGDGDADLALVQAELARRGLPRDPLYCAPTRDVCVFRWRSPPPP